MMRTTVRWNSLWTRTHKVQRADLTCDVIKKLAPFVLSKLWILVADWSIRWSRDMLLKSFDFNGNLHKDLTPQEQLFCLLWTFLSCAFPYFWKKSVIFDRTKLLIGHQMSNSYLMRNGVFGEVFFYLILRTTSN